MTRARRRAGVAGLALLLVGVAGESLLCGVEPRPASPAAPVTRAPSPAFDPPPANAVAVAPSPVPATRAVAPPVIDEIEIEKAEVCEGEENLVTVRAHTIDGNDPFLHYTVGSTAGSQVPVRTYLRASDGRPPRLAVTVFSKNNVATTAPVPEYRVKNCRADRMLLVAYRAVPNALAEYELSATITAPRGAPFSATRYEWSFGDGSSTVTAAPWVVHDFSGRRQRTAYAYVLVEVAASDAAGEVVKGRLAIAMRNPAFEWRERGVAALFAQPTPRFATMDPGGSVHQTFRLWHDEDEEVQVRAATLRKLTATAGDGATRAPESREVDVAAWLGSREVPAGPGLTKDLHYDFGAEPDVYAVTLELRGVTRDGRPARGQLTLMRPPPKPTRDNSIPVDDPAMVARIKKALSILGQDSVSQEDLSRLEREGKL